MPLRRGKGKKTMSANIAELLSAYEESGKIGNVKPRNKAHARRIAAAIAMKKAGKSKK